MVGASHLQQLCHPLQCLPILSHGPAILQHHNVGISNGSRNASSVSIHVICHTLSIFWSSIQGIDPDHHLQQETACEKGRVVTCLFVCLQMHLFIYLFIYLWFV
jgi:hypothetical protein